jgi:NADH-ubiquinone oxidoreductase chain 2
VAIALPSLNKQVSSVILTRITAIVFIYSGALALNALYIQSIGSGIGIFSGLFHVTMISQLFDAFLLILASLILVS